MAKVVLWKCRADDDGVPPMTAIRKAGETDAAYSARRGREIAEEVLRKQGRSTSAGEPVEVRKSTGAPVMTAAQHEAEIRKLEARLATTNANYAALEAMELINKRDPASTAKAGEIFKSDPQAYEAYRAQMVGQRWQAAVSEPEDTRGSIERSVAEGQAKLREIAKAQMDEQKLAAAKSALRNIFQKLKSRKDTQVAEARAELAELLGTAEGRGAIYDLAVIHELAAAV
jgi:hypothetical protein